MSKSLKSPTEKLDSSPVTGSERPRVIVKHWKDKEDQILKDNWASHSASEISAMLNRTRCSIIGRAARIGLPRKTNARKPGVGQIRAATIKPVLRKSRKKKKKAWSYKRNSSQVEKPSKVLAPLLIEDGAGIHILDLREVHCRSVIGKGPDGLARFCGKPKALRPDWKGEMMMVAFCEECSAVNYRSESSN